jgi:hypothetical protein
MYYLKNNPLLPCEIICNSVKSIAITYFHSTYLIKVLQILVACEIWYNVYYFVVQKINVTGCQDKS